MKKTISILLIALLAITCLVSCDEESNTEKLADCVVLGSVFTMAEGKNNLSLNVGDTWADAITKNSGKTISLINTLAPQFGEAVCELKECDGLPALYYGSDASFIFIKDSTADPLDAPSNKYTTSDTISETVYILFFGG